MSSSALDIINVNSEIMNAATPPKNAVPTADKVLRPQNRKPSGPPPRP